MLTNEIFDTFFEVLQPQTTQAPLSSLAEGKEYEQLLETARRQFEHALAEKLLTLSTKKQAAHLTQMVGLFEERAQQFAPLPAFTWQDFDRLANSPLEWARESNESAALKEFRDKCEHQIATDLESFLVLYRLGSDDARDASQLARLVTDYTPSTTDAFEMALDDEESQWVKNELGRQTVCKVQENVRQSLAKLVGKEAATRWIWSIDRWYDMHRENQGLLPVGGIFQHSCEAFHFYFSDLRTAAAPERPDEPAPTPPNSPWEPLLIGKMDLPAFFCFLADCGLMTTNGELTTLGQASSERKDRKAPWFGTLRALIDSKHLDNNAAVVCRAMIDPAGQINIKLSDNGLLYPSAKAGTYLTTANSRLKELGLLRK